MALSSEHLMQTMTTTAKQTVQEEASMEPDGGTINVIMLI